MGGHDDRLFLLRVRALNQWVPTEDVAMLIGDSLEIVIKHYSVWIHGRQERLTQRMVEALR